jgi:citrate lyase subunit beta/citryl-CoA lyase
MNAIYADVDRFAMRSKLFVPGNRPELFSKALHSDADVVCFDLEDAVLPAQKVEAHGHVQACLQANAGTERVIMVRVNGIHSNLIAEDLSAVVRPAVAAISLPKVEDPLEIEELSAALAELERERGLTRPIAIHPTIESPRGLRLAHAIAGADARVTGLQLGLVDLFESLGISQRDKFAAHHVRVQLRLAAAEAKLPCLDCAFPAFGDAEGFAAEAEAARGLGFSGKSCIHPSQIAAANQIFSPSAEEIAIARRTVRAASEAAAGGLGAFTLDGHMIDRPMIRRAEEILRFAARYSRDGGGE